MGVQRVAISDFRRIWRESLLAGTAVSVLSLMLGIFFQTMFYEIARNIPAVIRQDAHISLPLCRIFPDFYGCEPWVGALTSLEIWERSLQVGQVGGLLCNSILMVVFSMWITTRLRDKSALAGLLTGMAGLFASGLLALAFSVPLNLRSFLGIFGILVLLSLPLSGWIGGRIGKTRLARQLALKNVYFVPGDEAEQLEWSYERLSKRELEVLALVAGGLNNRDIAERLYISKATVKTHLIHIYAKLGVKNRTAAVTQALACGLLQKEEA